MGRKKIDLIGQKFGRLTVLKDSGKRKRAYVVWVCQCDCGNFKEVQSSCLTRKNKIGTKSCGCLLKEKSRERMKGNQHAKGYKHTEERKEKIRGQNNPNYKHGESRTPLYKKWSIMKQRILNPKEGAYKNYGGRGIKICPEWLDKEKGYINFRDFALSHGYQKRLTIDRIDNDGDYESSNCQFITLVENARKRQGTKYKK